MINQVPNPDKVSSSVDLGLTGTHLFKPLFPLSPSTTEKDHISKEKKKTTNIAIHSLSSLNAGGESPIFLPVTTFSQVSCFLPWFPVHPLISLISV